MSEINAIRFAEPWQVSCVKIPMPEPKPGEALIKIMAAGICGSDIGAFRGTNGLVSYPRVIGHELAGVVVSIPENNKNGIKVGDRVVVDPYLYCGHCYPCSIGRTNCCDDLHVLGVHVEGGMAEYFCHPADMLVKIPDGMSWVQAAMAEPLTISLHGIHRGGLKAGEYCAIIGAGPAGLTAAGDLAKLGYKVTVYEALHVAGGVLMYGIPEFRLPKAIVQQEIDGLKKMGVDFECNMVIGKVLTIDELMDEYGYEAVFVGSGAGLPRFMGIPGESLKGVYSANEFLTRSNLMKAYLPTSKTPIRTGKKVAVVGGGNVAMDAARSALRLGAETVYIVYRRGMAELPARKEEVEHAEEEGIIFKTLCNPVEIHANDEGFVKSITCIEMELGEPDASGRRRPIEKKGSEFELDVDTVIMSLGTSPNPLIRSTTPGLETNKHGCIVTDGDDGKTSRDGVYAGGDAVTGAATVIKAMGAGKAAAKAIDEYIQSK